MKTVESSSSGDLFGRKVLYLPPLGNYCSVNKTGTAAQTSCRLNLDSSRTVQIEVTCTGFTRSLRMVLTLLPPNVLDGNSQFTSFFKCIVTEMYNKILRPRLRRLLIIILSVCLLEDRKEVRVSALSQWHRHKSVTQRLIHSVALHHQSARLWI